MDYRNLFLFQRTAKDIGSAFYDKKTFINLFYQFRLKNTSYPVWCKLYDETEFIVDIANEMGREIFISGFIEPSVTYHLSGKMQAGDGFIDCGAHMGYYSKIASKAVGASGYVFAFEPNPDILEICQKNLNSDSNISLRNLAITDTGNEIELRMFGHDYSLYNTLLTEPRLNNLKPIKIVQVDSILLQDVIYGMRSKINSDNMIWIKLDIEGFEEPVIRSAIDAIADNECTVIFEGAFQPAVNQSIIDLFKSKNYFVYLICDLDIIPIDKLRDIPKNETIYYLARCYE